MKPNANEKRITDLLALSDQIGFSDIALRVAQEGGSIPEFFTAIGQRMREVPVHEAFAGIPGFDFSRDAGGYSLSRALSAMYDNRFDKAGLEKDVSNLAEKSSSSIPNGIYVPYSMLFRDLNAGTAAQAGNLIGTSRGNSFVDPLRNMSACLSLGAIPIQNCKEGVKMARVDLTVPVSATEIGTASEATASSTLIDLSPKRYPIKLITSIQAVKQSSFLLDVFFQKAFTAAVFDALDNEAINGSGTGSAALGVRATPNVGEVAAGTDGGVTHLGLAFRRRGQTRFRHLWRGGSFGMDSEFENSSLPQDGDKRHQSRLHLTKGGDHPLLGHRARVSNIMPSNLEKGSSGTVCSSMVFSNNWSNMLIAIYGGGLDITVDRITQAPIGKVVFNANLYAAVGLIRPQAFAMINDLKTA